MLLFGDPVPLRSLEGIMLFQQFEPTGDLVVERAVDALLVSLTLLASQQKILSAQRR